MYNSLLKTHGPNIELLEYDRSLKIRERSLATLRNLNSLKRNLIIVI